MIIGTLCAIVHNGPRSKLGAAPKNPPSTISGIQLGRRRTPICWIGAGQFWQRIRARFLVAHCSNQKTILGASLDPICVLAKRRVRGVGHATRVTHSSIVPRLHWRPAGRHHKNDGASNLVYVMHRSGPPTMAHWRRGSWNGPRRHLHQCSGRERPSSKYAESFGVRVIADLTLGQRRTASGALRALTIGKAAPYFKPAKVLWVCRL